jgi:hypothetical protein
LQCFSALCGFTTFTDTTIFYESVSEFQENCKLRDPHTLAFIDEKKFLSNSIPAYGLAPPNITPTVTVDTEIFPKRIDVIDSCTYDGVGPYRMYDKEARDALGVKGIRSGMVKEFFKSDIIPFLASRERFDQVVCGDRSTAHRPESLTKLCHKVLGDRFDEYWIIPAHAGKLVNPCDRDMHAEVQHSFAEFLTETSRTTQEMEEAIDYAYSSLPPQHAKGWFKRCGLLSGHYDKRRK